MEHRENKLILFDHQAYSIQKYGGISRMFTELIKGIKEEKSFNLSLPFKIDSNDNYNYLEEDDKSFHSKKVIPFPDLEQWNAWFNIPFKSVFYRLNKKYLNLRGYLYQSDLYAFNTRHILERINNADIFHPTYYDDYFWESLLNIKTKFVLTVYDLIHEKYMGYFSINDKVLQNKKKLCERADCIVAISNHTRNDLIDIYNIDPKKISVVHLASNFKPISANLNLTFSKKFLLYVGNREIYKNFLLMVEAIASILKDNDLYLVCAGGGDFNSEEKELFNKLGIRSRVIFIPIFEDSRLILLYQNALAFIYPSLDEGFGIPILESMSLKCPVICSDIPSFKEIANDTSALFFDPKCKNSIEKSVKSFLSDSIFSESLKTNGYEISKKFTWKKTVDSYIEIYKSLTNS